MIEHGQRLVGRRVRIRRRTVKQDNVSQMRIYFGGMIWMDMVQISGG